MTIKKTRLWIKSSKPPIGLLIYWQAKKEIYGNYKFTVELDGIEVAAFSSVSGISSEVELEEYKEGGLNSYAHQFVSNVKYPPIVT